MDFEPTQGSGTGWDARPWVHPWMTELTPAAGSGLLKPLAADALQIRTVSLGRFRTPRR